MKRLMFAVLLAFAVSAVYAGETDTKFNYQGRLIVGTNLVNGTVTNVFRLYNASAGGTLLYAETQKVTAVDGLYSTTIGINALTPTLYSALTNPIVYIEVAVNGVTLSPREQINQVAYAITAVRKSGDTMTGPLHMNAGAGSDLIISSSGQDVMVGNVANGNSYGAAVGFDANAFNYGATVGNTANGSAYGVGVGNNSYGSSRGVAVGSQAAGSDYGAGVGYNSDGSITGAAVGAYADGSQMGAALGYGAFGYWSGAAVGANANGGNNGTAIGRAADGYNAGVAVGRSANGSLAGVAVGAFADADNTGIAIGNSACGASTNIAIGWMAASGVGSERIAIGHAVSTPQDNAVAMRGTLFLDGGSNVYFRTNFGSGVWTALASGGSTTGFVQKTGDTMTGTLTINDAAANSLSLSSARTNIAIGAAARASAGSERIAIGHNVTNAINNTAAIRGSLYLDGGTGIYYRSSFGSGSWSNLIGDPSQYVQVSGDQMTGALGFNIGAGGELVITNSPGGAIEIGYDANGWSGVALGSSANGAWWGVAMGTGATGFSYSVGIGHLAKATNMSVAIGSEARAMKQYDTAVGYQAVALTNATALGSGANADGYAVSVGRGANAHASGIAIGYLANVHSNAGVAIGSSSMADYGGGVAVGPSANARYNGGVAVGRSANSGIGPGVAIGYGAQASSTNIAIGAGASTAYGSERIAIGHNITNLYNNSTAVRGTLYIDGTGTADANIKYRQTFGTGAWSTKAFVIDHPLDPENKVLRHFCAEGPVVQNIYNGTEVLDANGEAVVQLPAYFDRLNINPQYLLTPVGAQMNLYVKEEISGNRFVVGGGVAGAKVSWMIMAQRNDPAAIEDLKQRPVEQLKSELSQGQIQAENSGFNTDASK
ncbi:MAG: beta strand repeat-containing protein [Kiritimatiellia bacterium]